MYGHIYIDLNRKTIFFFKCYKTFVVWNTTCCFHYTIKTGPTSQLFRCSIDIYHYLLMYSLPIQHKADGCLLRSSSSCQWQILVTIFTNNYFLLDYSRCLVVLHIRVWQHFPLLVICLNQLLFSMFSLV